MEMTKSTKFGRTTGKSKRPLKSGEVPATMNVVHSVRDELNHKIDSVKTELHHKIDSVKTELNHKIDSVKTELNHKIDSVKTELNHKIDSVNADLSGKMDSLNTKMDTGFNHLSNQIHQIKILMEEQNARNRYVLDGYASLYERQERLEQEWKAIKKS